MWVQDQLLLYEPVHRNIYVTNYQSNEAPGNTVSVISTTPPAPPNTLRTSAIDGNNNPVFIFSVLNYNILF